MDQSLAAAEPRRLLPVLGQTGAAAATAPGAAGPAPKIQTLVDQFLEQQASSTAVERFSQHHDGEATNSRERWYRDLLPATPPGPGQQYAFEVDLDACSGCKSCVVACNSLNGLGPDEAWRSVGTLVGVGERGVVQPVTTSCHHCVEPGCLEGCPVDAYEKDPVTGIVEHLDDQCIGCRYCTLTCPYDVPQYRGDLGIVRKCDMCHDRLAEGEAPACVQACPTQAIAIRVVDLEDVGSDAFPFASPAPETTRPTTRFLTTRDLQDEVQPSDLPTIVTSHAHLPLTVMLVLTQASVGAYGLLALLSPGLRPEQRAGGDRAALAMALVALAASIAHLGRPHLAWRAVIGLRHSWLSREIVAFGAFAGLAALVALGGLIGVEVPAAGRSAAAAIGLVAVLASAMVYVVTARTHWRWTRTVPRFLATCLAGGGALTASVLVTLAALERTPGSLALEAATPAAIGGSSAGALTAMVAAAGLGAVIGLVIDLVDALRRKRGASDARGRTGMLLTGVLRGHLTARVVAGLLGVGALAVARSTAATNDLGVALGFVVVGTLGVLAGEFLERWWFFTAESDLRMPGGRR